MLIELTWANYLGMAARGFPQSLVFLLLPNRVTSDPDPGPGPIRLQDWKHIASEYVAGSQLVLRSDSARAYDYSIENVVHKKTEVTKVDHQMKKVDSKWKDPYYTKFLTFTLPDRSKFKIVAGTQCIGGVTFVLGSAAKMVILLCWTNRPVRRNGISVRPLP